MSETVNQDRRRFLGTAAVKVAAALLGMIGDAGAQTGNVKPANGFKLKTWTGRSFSAP